MQVMSLNPFNLTISHGYCKESGMSDFDVLSWLYINQNFIYIYLYIIWYVLLMDFV